ncbi:MAG: ABC transporter ATP-binding protein [Aggregatilineales bacterium]
MTNMTVQTQDSPASSVANEPFIICHSVVKAYRIGESEIVALRGIDFTMQKGEMVSIIGPSGAGKSSLLNLLGGLDKPTAGRLMVDKLDLLSLKERALSDYCLRRVGFLWQQVERNLLPNRSALRNVTLPMLLAGIPTGERIRRATELLGIVGLAKEIDRMPAQMSLGQQQRVAIAVALANRPKLILLDEPTGSLDRKAATQVMNLLNDLRQQYGLTVLMVTHDLGMATYADRVLTLRDGSLGQDLTHTTENGPSLDSAGNLKLPDLVRLQLSNAPRIGIEIRPEGVLLRPEYDSIEDPNGLAQNLLPQDTPPKRRGFRLFERAKPADTRKAG